MGTDNTEIETGFVGSRWTAVADATALRREAYRRIVDAASRAISQRGRFLIVLAGGNTPRDTYRMLRGADADWSRWQIHFGDERCLPADDPERNSQSAGDTWLDHVAIPKNNVHAIATELGAEAAAHAYICSLRDVDNFDLVLLGLGEDGHTASLFPGHDWGESTNSPDALAIFDAPKAPPERVSLSAARLSRAREVLFLVEGEAKRDAVTRWRDGEQLPAAAIRPVAGVDVLVEASLLLPVAI
jgi:6-phosphogluconolactonase